MNFPVSAAKLAGAMRFAGLLALCPIANCSSAQPGYPEKPIRLIVPFAAGGSTDVLARVVGQKLAEKLGQQIVIDNRAGAGGTIGTEIAARAAADGYTLVVGTTSTLAINESLYRKLGYDISRDFVPITLLAKGPFVLMVTPGLPVTTLKELIAYAKGNPGKLSIASSGNGTSVHLSAELFKIVAGMPQVAHVPYKGGGPAGLALMAGEVQMMINDLPPAIGPIRAGRLRAIAVADAKRAQLLPDVPTFAEAGLPGYESLSWFGLLAPASTPATRIATLNAVVANIVRTDHDLKERLVALGVDPVGSTPAELARYAREEARKWADVIRKANIKLEEGRD
jgi:tripartite-type tricarboxylate transporter receptor subunit TctC